jgi:hypothetical protein
MDEHSAALQVCGHICQGELDVLVGGDGFPKLLACFSIGNCFLKTEDGSSEAGGANVDPPPIQPFHRDGETLTLGTEHVGRGHTHVLEVHDRGGLAIPAQLVLVGAESDTWTYKATLIQHT